MQFWKLISPPIKQCTIIYLQSAVYFINNECLEIGAMTIVMQNVMSATKALLQEMLQCKGIHFQL